jgi:arabinofuranan 3-O-arabinosyltransferase
VQVQTSVAALLVVHENENPGWQATLDGTTLPAVTVDGWQQAWVVPAGASGVIHLDFTPQAAFTAGLLGGAGAAAVLLLLTLPLPAWRRRRPAPAALRATSLGTVARWTTVVAALTLLGSVSGLIVGVVLVVVDAAAPTTWRSRPGLWAVAIILGAAVTAETAATVASRHPLAGSAGVQLLCLVALGIVLDRCLISRDRPPGAGEPTQ